MRKRTLVFVSIVALAISGALFAAPSISQADPITITEIKVSVGGVVWCGSTVAGDCTGTVGGGIWTAGLGSGITLASGESLILTQTSGFNMDSSQRNGGGDCSPTLGTVCVTTLEINHVVVTLSGAGVDNLADNNHDPGNATGNEATDWGSAGTALTFGAVYFGYADNVHTDACQDGGNCLPSFGSTIPTSLWGPGAGRTFIGAGADGFGSTTQGDTATHCSTTTHTTDCFDAGAILIYNTQVVPEPVTMFLGGTGLLLLGYAARRRLFVR